MCNARSRRISAPSMINGGGYGDPLDRDPRRVLLDVIEGWETRERAQDIYGVVLREGSDHEDISVDEPATTSKRASLRAGLAAGTPPG
jgi:N-methylhydantoinase B